MKHIFVVNPHAGKGKGQSELNEKIRRYCDSHDVEYEIYTTTAAGDGTRFVKERASSGESIRFYAVGGDGTLYEVVNGAYGFPNVEVGIIPIGSGNDFIRLFGGKDAFSDIAAQINGTPAVFDLIRCGDKYAINQCSMGFDAEVCAKQAEFKKLPFLKGETAYVASLLFCFLTKMDHVFTIKIDEDEPFTSPVLFCVGANSRWYGGGFKCAPCAMPDDGELDFVILKKAFNKLKLLTIINKYKRGEHMNWPITVYRRGKKINIKSDELAAVNIDGECDYVTESTFEVIPRAIKFSIPTVSRFFEQEKSGELSNKL